MTWFGVGDCSGGLPAAMSGVPNVTVLRALVGIPQAVVELLDYDGSTPATQGLFQWDAGNAIDDGVLRFNVGGLGSNGPGWQRVLDGPLTLWMGGAVGDGIADDTAAVQRVLNTAASAASPSSDVYVPPGTWLVTSGLSVKSSAVRPLTVYGAGPESNLHVVLAGNDTDAIVAGVSPFEYITIRDLKLSGTFTRGIFFNGIVTNVRIDRCDLSGATGVVAATYNALIAFQDATDDVWITNCYFHGAGGGNAVQGYNVVRASGTAGSRMHVRDNRVQNTAAQFGIALFDMNDSDAMGNYVDQNNIGLAAGGTGYGILFYRTIAIPSMNRNQASNNYVTNTAGIGIYFQSSFDSLISDNILFDCCKTQTEVSLPLGAISANGDRNNVVGNVVRTTPQAGINMTGDQGNIAGNKISDATKFGIFLQGAISSVAVVGNDISGGINGIIMGASSVGDGQTITGNSCQSGTGTGTGIGVAAPGVNFFTIADNYCREYLDNIFIEAGAQFSITGNVCRAALQDNMDVRCNNGVIANNVCQAATNRGIFCSGNQVNILNNEITASGGLPIDYTGSANSWGEKNRFSAAGAMNGSVALGAGGTALVLTAEIQAGDIVRLTRTAAGGVMGNLTLGAIVAATSFVINSDNAADTSTVFWEIVH